MEIRHWRLLWNALPHHLRSHSSESHFLLSLSSSQFHKQLKTHLFFILILLSLLLLSTGLTLWNFNPACSSFIMHSISFILDPFICSTRFNLLFCHIECQNRLKWIYWILASFVKHLKSSSYHHIFHFTFSHFISSFVCHMHVVLNEEKIKLKLN